MKILATAALITALGGLSVPAHAQFQKTEDAVKYRKAALTLMGNHVGRIGAMANGRVPFDAKVASESADILETVSRLPWEAFVPGSDKGDTRAESKIWSEQDKFKQRADNMQAEVAKLTVAAKTGNLDSVKAAFGAVGQSCKACHDAYRKN